MNGILCTQLTLLYWNLVKGVGKGKLLTCIALLCFLYPVYEGDGKGKAKDVKSLPSTANFDTMGLNVDEGKLRWTGSDGEMPLGVKQRTKGQKKELPNLQEGQGCCGEAKSLRTKLECWKRKVIDSTP